MNVLRQKMAFQSMIDSGLKKKQRQNRLIDEISHNNVTGLFEPKTF
jgi:hypothetical protein